MGRPLGDVAREDQMVVILSPERQEGGWVMWVERQEQVVRRGVNPQAGKWRYPGSDYEMLGEILEHRYPHVRFVIN